MAKVAELFNMNRIPGDTGLLLPDLVVQTGCPVVHVCRASAAANRPKCNADTDNSNIE